MKQSIPLVRNSGFCFPPGCATKKYVRKQVDPVSGKLDQVASKTDQQGQTLDQTRTEPGRNSSDSRKGRNRFECNE